MRSGEEGMKVQEQATKEVRRVELFLDSRAPMIDMDIGNSSILSVQLDGGATVNLITEQTMEAFGQRLIMRISLIMEDRKKVWI